MENKEGFDKRIVESTGSVSMSKAKRDVEE